MVNRQRNQMDCHETSFPVATLPSNKTLRRQSLQSHGPHDELSTPLFHHHVTMQFYPPSPPSPSVTLVVVCLKFSFFMTNSCGKKKELDCRVAQSDYILKCRGLILFAFSSLFSSTSTAPIVGRLHFLLVNLSIDSRSASLAQSLPLGTVRELTSVSDTFGRSGVTAGEFHRVYRCIQHSCLVAF